MTPARTRRPRRNVAAARAAVVGRVRAVRAEPERGDVVGWAVTLPAALLLFVATLQVGLWFQARAMCHAAALAGAQAGAAYLARSGSGRETAAGYLHDEADTSVHDAQVTESRTRSQVTVRCAGRPLTLLALPGLGEVSATVTSARERFTNPAAP